MITKNIYHDNLIQEEEYLSYQNIFLNIGFDWLRLFRLKQLVFPYFLCNFVMVPKNKIALYLPVVHFK